MAKVSISESKKKQILFVLGCGVGLLFWFQLFFIPQRTALSANSPKVRSLERQLKDVRQNCAQLPRLEAELSHLSSQEGIPSAAPEQQLLEILGMIAQTARLAQVQLTNLKPKIELSQLSPGQNGFLELPVEANALGGYHQIGTFLDALERSDALMKLQSLEIRPDSRSIWKHQAILLLQVYLIPRTEQGKP